MGKMAPISNSNQRGTEIEELPKEPMSFDKWLYWNRIFSTDIDTFIAEVDTTHPDFKLELVEQTAKAAWPGNYVIKIFISSDSFKPMLKLFFKSPSDETWCRLSWKQK